MSDEPPFISQKPERDKSSAEEEERIAELIAELLYEQMKRKNPEKVK